MNLKKSLCLLLSLLLVLSSFAVSAYADTSEDGYLTYTIENGEVTITDCDTSISGEYTIPDTIEGYPVTAIGDEAFYDCELLTGIFIPGSVKIIGDHAFYYCSSLKNIEISTGVTEIGSVAFGANDTITEIEIPSSVQVMGDSMFKYCDSLKKITVSDDNEYFSSDSYGVLYNKDKTELVEYPCSGATEYIIPNSVTVIKVNAFSGCQKLKKIEIPNSVISIEASAFTHCENLTNIEIPASVTFIESMAFDSCYSLEGIFVSEDNKFFSSDSYGVLYNKDKTELVAYPYNGATEYTIPDGVVSIGEGAFSNCRKLEKIEIPDSVTSIGYLSFWCCDSLKTIEISENVTYIGSTAFRSCYVLEGIFVSEDNDYYSSDSYGVLFNKDKTELIQFPIGSGITEYSIPDGVTNIYDDAFYNATSLNKISIPESVISIGSSVFSYTGYYENNSNWEDGVLYIDNCLISARNLTTETYAVKDGTRLIAESAFNSLTSIKNIILPDSVTSINDWAFNYCESLTSITIPDSVISIGFAAFYSTSENLIIHGVCGSTAYDYAKNHSINFEATEHPDTEIRNAVESTCTEDGYTGDICCYYCGEILEYGAVIPSANGHTFTDWETVKEATYLEQGETSRYCTVCGYTETEAIDCIIPDASASDGDVEINYTEGTFDGDVTVKADKVQDENKYLLITDHFRNNGKNARAEIYDISTYVYNQKVQPNGSVLVRIPIPQGYNREKICVVYITDNGEIQNVPCRCADGYVYFEASHFSMYAIVEATEDETDDDSSSVSSFVQFICKFVRLLCKLFGKEAYYDALEQSIVKILGAIF
ncbi:MAG: leucine-rich repeat domain-containing protein [Clostridiales bacterium]|nr:leucine-rich repeat domain-containing protein [Clostridiales bacterium]